MLGCMRTTITLDDDVHSLLQKLQDERGLTFKEATNLALRKGLYRLDQPEHRQNYEMTTFDLGEAKIDLDDIGEVLAVVEGEDHR